MSVAGMRAALLAGTLTPATAVADAIEGLRALPAVVIGWVDGVEEMVARLGGVDPSTAPLWGIPFAVKDNIDVAGALTTAGCPSFAYRPDRSAAAVERLVAAGAIPVAKTNLDQFATGLVGTRSPYGTPLNPFNPALVPGGSSSGSAVAVAHGAVPFAIGTDTAGSGRVPAAFCGIVGLKPTCGWVSGRGVVPAVRSVDCVSVFALSVADAWLVTEVMGGFDPLDPFSRRACAAPSRAARIGVADVSVAGATVDISALIETGGLLYGGSFVAERMAAVGESLGGAGVDPVVRRIIQDGSRWSATDAARDRYRLGTLRHDFDRVWDKVDVIVTPTAATHPTLAAVVADPIGANTAIGRYTSGVNLLDLCAVAVPTTIDGGPTGVSVIGPAWHDAAVASVAARLHPALGGVRGTSTPPLADDGWEPDPTGIQLAVVGAHLRGMPLHGQLVELGAAFVTATTTTPDYRLYALPGTEPPKPGLVRVADGEGAEIEVEVYALTPDSFGRFVAAVPPPLCIGIVRLRAGPVSGFLCEPAAVGGAVDITSYRGWRAYTIKAG